MSYSKKTWSNGDDVTPADFNRIEQGIEDNANKINILSNERGYLKTKILVDSINLDTVVNNGIYQVNTSTAGNVPKVFGVAYLTVKATSSQFLVQEIVYLNGDYKFYRKCVNGVWSVWSQTALVSKPNITLYNGWVANDCVPIVIRNGTELRVFARIKSGARTAGTLVAKIGSVDTGISNQFFSIVSTTQGIVLGIAYLAPSGEIYLLNDLSAGDYLISESFISLR